MFFIFMYIYIFFRVAKPQAQWPKAIAPKAGKQKEELSHQWEESIWGIPPVQAGQTEPC